MSCAFSSCKPVRRLDQEHIRRLAENVAHRGSRTESTIEFVESTALLLPDKEERRAWTILPAHDRIAAQRLNPEVRISNGKTAGRSGAIGIDGVPGLVSVTRDWCNGASVRLAVNDVILSARLSELLEVFVPAR